MRFKIASGLGIGTLLLGGTCLLAAPVPTTYDVQLPLVQFGRIDQGNVPANGPGAAGVNSCAPTATMNSFQYLNTAFPTVYGTNATTGNPTLQGTSASWTLAAVNLAQNFMGTTNASGTSDTNWINGKRNYLESLAPGKTTYGGEDSVAQGAAASNVQNANPDAMFLYNALKAGADVEIGISPGAGGGIGHVLTLASIHWVDNDSNGTFNAGDTLTLDGIDPGGGLDFTFTMAAPAVAGGPMTITGGTGTAAGGGYNGYVFDAALTETPVPEPTVLGIAGVGAILGLLRRSRARRA